MIYKILKIVFVACCSLCISLEALHQPFIRIRQDSGRGIGYGSGYTTLEGTLYAFSPHKKIVPFVDLRAHHFNNNHYAMNAGVGLRIASSLKALGINAYYDYRDVPNLHFQQIGIGLETLNTLWNLRINGYFPIGKKSRLASSSKITTYFDDYCIYEEAFNITLKGMNAEVEFLIVNSQSFSLWISAGPYFYHNTQHKLLGGKIALRSFIRQLFSLSASITHDPFFGTRGQAQISFTVPLGNKKKLSSYMNNIAMQPVQRNEILVLNKETGYNWNW